MACRLIFQPFAELRRNQQHFQLRNQYPEKCNTRKRVRFLTQINRLDSSFLEVLQKADKTFVLKEDQKFTAVNDKGFEVDIVRRTAIEDDPHPLRMTDNEDDFARSPPKGVWAVQISSGSKLLGAKPFNQIAVSSTGSMATIRTIDPLDFARINLALGLSKTRDVLKAPKDLLQAQLVNELVKEYLPHLLKADIPSQGLGF